MSGEQPTIRPETVSDLPGITELVRLAFAGNPAEPRLVELLHKYGNARFSTVAEQETLDI